MTAACTGQGVPAAAINQFGPVPAVVSLPRATRPRTCLKNGTDTVGEVGSGAVGSFCVVPLAPAVGGIRPTSGHMAGFWRRGERP
jgi:hypothetical protein